MVDYQPIAELVNQIPADTWEVLQEIQKRRPAMMLDELLNKRERTPKLTQSRSRDYSQGRKVNTN
jgi:sporulation-control protein spo0M